MREQLKLLDDLQRHDARIQEIEAEARAIPDKLRELRDNIARIQGVLDRERVQLAETERYRIEQETQLKHEEQQLAKARAKAQAVKNQKEYMSIQREIELTRKMAQEREEEALKLGIAVEAFSKQIDQHTADVAALQQAYEEQEGAGRQRAAELEQKLAGLRAERDGLAAKVRPDVLRKYSAIKLKKGLAVVAVKDRTCQGCNMMIPPQLFNTLQRRDTIELCPTCNRIIYWDKIMEEQRLEAGEGAE